MQVEVLRLLLIESVSVFALNLEHSFTMKDLVMMTVKEFSIFSLKVTRHSA